MPLFLWAFLMTQKKCHVSPKKPLRGPALIRKYPLTGGAEAHNGMPDGTTEQRSIGKDGKKTEISEAGRVEEVTAHLGDFVSMLFEIDGYLKRYAGGLVHATDSLVYRALRTSVR
jgi:hypothetical protein